MFPILVIQPGLLFKVLYMCSSEMMLKMYVFDTNAIILVIRFIP